MKYLFPALLLLACVRLPADVTIECKKEGKESGVIRIKIKGDHARIDTDGPMGSITVLMDKDGKVATYVHQSKLALISTMTDAEKAAKALIKKAGADTAKSDPFTNTGETQK